MFKTILYLTFIISNIQTARLTRSSKLTTSQKAISGMIKPLVLPERECINTEEPVKALQSVAGNHKKSINANALKTCKFGGIGGQYRTYNVDLNVEGHECNIEFTVETGNRSGSRVIVRDANNVREILKNCFVVEKVSADHLEQETQIADSHDDETNFVSLIDEEEEYPEDFEPEEVEQVKTPVHNDEDLYLNEVSNEDEFSAAENADIEEAPVEENASFNDNDIKLCDDEDLKNAEKVFVSKYNKYYINHNNKLSINGCHKYLPKSGEYKYMMTTVYINTTICTFEYTFRKFVPNHAVASTDAEMKVQLDECNAREQAKQEIKALALQQKKTEKNKKKRQNKLRNKRAAQDQNNDQVEVEQSDENLNTDILYQNEDEYMFKPIELNHPTIKEVDEEEEEDLDTSSLYKNEDEFLFNNHHNALEKAKCDTEDKKEVSAGFLKAYKNSHNSETNNIEVAECYTVDRNNDYRVRNLVIRYDNTQCNFEFRFDQFVNGVKVNDKKNVEFFAEEIRRCDEQESLVKSEREAAKKLKKKNKKKAAAQKKKERENNISARLEAVNEESDNSHKHKVGAYSDQEWTRATELYKELVVADLFEGKIIYKQNVVSVSTQVVAGLNYSVIFSFNGEKCHLQVYSSIADRKYYIYHDQVAAGKLSNDHFIASMSGHPFTERNCADVFGSAEIRKAIELSHI